jgi:hypothetical protein
MYFKMTGGGGCFLDKLKGILFCAKSQQNDFRVYCQKKGASVLGGLQIQKVNA